MAYDDVHAMGAIVSGVSRFRSSSIDTSGLQALVVAGCLSGVAVFFALLVGCAPLDRSLRTCRVLTMN